MAKIDLLEVVTKLLKTEADLDFLLKLSEIDLGILILCIRERCGLPEKQSLKNYIDKEIL